MFNIFIFCFYKALSNTLIISCCLNLCIYMFMLLFFWSSQSDCSAFHFQTMIMKKSHKAEHVLCICKIRYLLLYSRFSVFEWKLWSFAPRTQYVLFTLTGASHSSALMHSVGTHVEYTCKTKTQVSYIRYCMAQVKNEMLRQTLFFQWQGCFFFVFFLSCTSLKIYRQQFYEKTART